MKRVYPTSFHRAEVRSGEPTTATTYNNAWSTCTQISRNAKIVIKKCEEDPSEKGNVVTEAIAKILLAYNGAVAADVFGNTPYSQTGILNPDGTPCICNLKGIHRKVSIRK